MTSLAPYLLTLAACTAPAAGTGDLASLAKSAMPSVFLLTMMDDHDKAISTATGFIISRDGRLATNHHVLAGAHHIEAKAPNGSRYTVLGVIASDPDSDLAILKLDRTGFHPLLFGNTKTVEVGQRVLVIGSPRGLEGTVSEGIVSAIRKAGTLQMTAAISPGSSGSPVLNRNGKVIGVATAQMQSGQTLNFAVPVDLLAKLNEKSKSTEGWGKITDLQDPSTRPDAILQDPEFMSCTELIQNGKAAEILKIAQNLVQRYPNDYRSHQILGRVYAAVRFHTEAIGAFQQSLKLKLDSGDTWAQLGIVYGSLGRDEDAQFAFEQSVKFDPTYARGSAMSILGCMYVKAKREAEGIVLLERVVRLRSGKELPSDVKTLESLALAYANSGQIDKARGLVEKVRMLDRDEARFLEGYILVKSR